MSPVIGINGFGRIGKLVARVCIERGIRVALINDPFVSPEAAAYAVNHDSVHGNRSVIVSHGKDTLTMADGTEILVSTCRNPSEIAWAAAHVDIVVEASGAFTHYKDASRHLNGGARRVIITAPSPDANMYVPGVNCDAYADEAVISLSSCTTNCLGHLVRALHTHYGITKGLMSTVHAITATQPCVDGHSKKDLRSGRSGLLNIIPASTGAARAIGKIIPELDGKITGMAFRVPVADVSVVDFTCELKTAASAEEINRLFRTCADTSEYVGYDARGGVSSDYVSCAKSCIVDGSSTMAIDNMAKVVAFYDNEYGYSNRVVDMALKIHK